MSESIPNALSYSSPEWFIQNDVRVRFAMAKARVCYDFEAMRRARAKCASLRPVEDAAVAQRRRTERRREKIVFVKDRHRAIVARRAETRPSQRIADVTTFDRLQRAVSRATGVSKEVLKSRRRDIPVTAARSLLMWLARQHMKVSYPWIGQRLGGRDHTTVMSNVRRVEAIRSGEDCMWPRLNIRIRRDLARVEALLR